MVWDMISIHEDYEVYQTVIEKTTELLGVELKRKLPDVIIAIKHLCIKHVKSQS